jgi:two-component system sensor histidine kinase UhpB
MLPMACTDDQLVLSVTDDARGLPEDVREGGGLIGMRERAMLIGADLDVSTNAGVSVTPRLP